MFERLSVQCILNNTEVRDISVNTMSAHFLAEQTGF